MRLLLLPGIVGLILAVYAADRLLKARAQARRLRRMTARLEAAAARADVQHERQQVAKRASEALTSFMPAIQRPPSALPELRAHGPARPHAPGERAGKNDHDTGHGGRRGIRSGKYRARVPERPAHSDAARAGAARNGRPAG